MRYLLLLLLSVLIPLQSLAATAPLQPQRSQPAASVMLACSTSAAAQHEQGATAAAQLADPGHAGLPADDDDGSCAQADLEDPSLPARIATPQAHWQPFPHAFLAPLSWPSYLRDQLRPPPLA